MPDSNWNDSDRRYRGNDYGREPDRGDPRFGGRDERRDERQYDERWEDRLRSDAPYSPPSPPRRSRDVGWGFGADNPVGSRSYDWGSPEYGNRAPFDRNFGRPWDRGNDLRYGNEYAAFTAGLATGRRPSYAGRGPKNYQRSDERIKEDANHALERHPEIDASEIVVEVADGVITLRGHVEDRRQKRMSEDALEQIYGVRDIKNELVIDQSLFQQAKEFFTHHEQH